MTHTRPTFRVDDWEEYKKVNEKFAAVLLKEMEHTVRPLVFIQDFQFTLLPQIIKRNRPDAQVGIFWHIPWPNAEAFSICPWKKEILQGMLGADVIGFHTQQFCNNFMETVTKEVESLADFEQFSITRDGHTAYIKPFPIGTITTAQNEPPQVPDREVLKHYGVTTKYVGIGVDRMDYAKGILERLRAVEFFLSMYPAYKKQFTFLQITAPANETAQSRQFTEDVEHEVARINKRFEVGDWKPIVLVNKHHSHEQIHELYKVGDLCLVTSLHDGMNLVAKEYVAARDDETGVLILSQFTGAARDMRGALIVNPYSAEQTAEAIHTALTMPKSEQRSRMSKMRGSVMDYNIYRWSAELIKALVQLD